MSHHDKPAVAIHLHRIEVPCSLHDRHVYYVAGLDHAADDATEFLLQTLRRNGFKVEYDASILDTDYMRSLLFHGEMGVEDIPF